MPSFSILQTVASEIWVIEDAISIFKALGISDVELLTNNPEKLAAFEGSGINLKKRKLQVGVNEFNRKYLQSKRDLMSHTLGEI